MATFGIDREAAADKLPVVTNEQLQAIMPGLPAAKRTLYLPFLQGALTEFGINTPAREAAFAAQVAHESGQFRFMEEIWGPTDAQKRYEPVTTLSERLGNTDPGDGKRFKGRGPIQITGRDNYRRFGGLLGLDLVASPERASTPEVAFRIAALFWQKNGLNELADAASAPAFVQITKRINGGLNGLADRQKFYDAACRVFGVTIVPGTRAALPPPPPLFPRGFEAIEATRAPRRAKPRTAKKRKVKRAAGPKKRASAARGRTRKAAAKRPGKRKR